MTSARRRAAIVFPVDAKERLTAKLEDSRFGATAAALRAAGLEVEGAPYADEAVEDVRAQLLRVDAVLVWVNPNERGRDRSVLNALLVDVASQGVLVSAHPMVIDRMGTKEVLYRTRTYELELRYAPLRIAGGDASGIAEEPCVRPARTEADPGPERRRCLESRVGRPEACGGIAGYSRSAVARPARQAWQP